MAVNCFSSCAADQTDELLDRLHGAAGDPFRALTAEWMFDEEQWHPRDPERRHLTHGEPLEHGGPDQSGGRAGLRDLDRVVETPRRAGPSVRGAGEDDVTLLRHLHDDLGGGGRGRVGLAPVDDLRDAV
jgi:hypothetical protein